MGKATGFLEFDRRDDSWVNEEARITNFDEFHNHLNEEERREVSIRRKSSQGLLRNRRRLNIAEMYL